MKEKIIQFMRGRYGYDELSKVLLVGSLVLTLLSGIRGLELASFLGSGILLVVFLRVFSKNYQKCSLQNQKYLTIKNKLLKPIRGSINRFKQRKDYRFYTCPSCGQDVRVPKGKGKVTITCPKCHEKFSKTT